MLAAYLFRNIGDRDAVLRSVWDLLAPGGVLVVQDYSVAGSSSARVIWNAVSWSVVIPLSKIINRDTSIYRYLWRSVLDNDSVDVFAGTHAAGRLRRRGAPYGRRLAARHPAHLPRTQARVSSRRAREWRPGKDRQAVRHPGAPGARRAPDGSSALVVGGGIAGLAAATGLAERGVRVTLIEREPQLGGRVRAWPLDSDSPTVRAP